MAGYTGAVPLLEELGGRLSQTRGGAAMTLRLNCLVASFAGLWRPQRSENGHTIAGSQYKLEMGGPRMASGGSHDRRQVQPRNRNQ